MTFIIHNLVVELRRVLKYSTIVLLLLASAGEKCNQPLHVEQGEIKVQADCSRLVCGRFNEQGYLLITLALSCATERHLDLCVHQPASQKII